MEYLKELTKVNFKKMFYNDIYIPKFYNESINNIIIAANMRNDELVNFFISKDNVNFEKLIIKAINSDKFVNSDLINYLWSFN